MPAAAFERTAAILDPEALADVPAAHVRTRYASGEVRILVDLGGLEVAPRGEAALERLALATIHEVLVGDAYGSVATQLDVALVEFSSYDEYGAGVLESAEVAWSRRFDAASLERFIRATAGGPR